MGILHDVLHVGLHMVVSEWGIPLPFTMVECQINWSMPKLLHCAFIL